MESLRPGSDPELLHMLALNPTTTSSSERGRQAGRALHATAQASAAPGPLVLLLFPPL